MHSQQSIAGHGDTPSRGARRTVVAGGAALLVSCAALTTGVQSAHAAPASGVIYVLNGLAGETLDVLVDGQQVASASKPKTILGPLTLEAGTHSVTLNTGSTVRAGSTFVVAANSTTDLVAHRFPDAQRAPTITAFPNDLSAVGPGKTRLRVAHTAVVPPADIVVNGMVLVRNIANGESSTNVVPGGSYTVKIVPTLTSGPAVLGPVTLTVRAGTLTNVFAIGDPVAKTMDAIVQELPISMTGAAVPATVNTGDGGQAAGLFSSSRDAAGRDALGVPVTALGLATLFPAAVLFLAGLRRTRGGRWSSARARR